MAKYRKKPVIVEAFRWDGSGEVLGVVFGPEKVVMPFGEVDKFFVVTIHQRHAYLAPGDWIITEPDGVHHYPCKPDIFAATYDSA